MTYASVAAVSPHGPGSFYFNARHQAQAEAKASLVAPPLPPDDDPILEDDDFVEEADEDDPIPLVAPDYRRRRTQAYYGGLSTPRRA